MKRAVEIFYALLPKAATLLWLIGYGLMFIAGISSLWGWDVLAWVSSIGLLALFIDQRKTLWPALTSRRNQSERLLAAYLLFLGVMSMLVNIVVIVL